MAQIKKILAAVQTRNKKNASTRNKLRIRLGEIYPLEMEGSIPGEGKAGLLHVDTDLDYYSSAGAPITLSIDGDNLWMPQVAFVWGEVDFGSGHIRYIPMGMNFDANPFKPRISTDSSEGVDEWNLEPITRGAGDIYHSYNIFVLYMKTADHELAGSPGPLELSIIGQIYSESEARLKRHMVYQTILPKIGEQEPTARGEHYLFRVPLDILGIDGFKFHDIFAFSIMNKSDNMWMSEEIMMFAVDTSSYGQKKGMCVGKSGQRKVSLNPHDGPGADPSHQMIIYALSNQL